MRIELDAQTVDRLKREAEKEVKAAFVEEMLDMLRREKGQLRNEIKNEIVKEATVDLTQKIRKQHNVDDVINRSLQSAAATVNTQIHKALKNGITVKFDGLPKQ